MKQSTRLILHSRTAIARVLTPDDESKLRMNICQIYRTYGGRHEQCSPHSNARTQWFFRPYWKRVRVKPLEIGDRVRVLSSPNAPGAKGKIGILRYLGKIHCASGSWAGLQLEVQIGENDGSLDGHRYFLCRPGRGLFVRTERCKIYEGRYTVDQRRRALHVAEAIGQGGRDTPAEYGHEKNASATVAERVTPEFASENEEAPCSFLIQARPCADFHCHTSCRSSGAALAHSSEQAKTPALPRGVGASTTHCQCCGSASITDQGTPDRASRKPLGGLRRASNIGGTVDGSILENDHRSPANSIDLDQALEDVLARIPIEHVHDEVSNPVYGVDIASTSATPLIRDRALSSAHASSPQAESLQEAFEVPGQPEAVCSTPKGRERERERKSDNIHSNGVSKGMPCTASWMRSKGPTEREIAEEKQTPTEYLAHCRMTAASEDSRFWERCSEDDDIPEKWRESAHPTNRWRNAYLGNVMSPISMKLLNVDKAQITGEFVAGKVIHKQQYYTHKGINKRQSRDGEGEGAQGGFSEDSNAENVARTPFVVTGCNIERMRAGVRSFKSDTLDSVLIGRSPGRGGRHRSEACNLYFSTLQPMQDTLGESHLVAQSTKERGYQGTVQPPAIEDQKEGHSITSSQENNGAPGTAKVICAKAMASFAQHAVPIVHFESAVHRGLVGRTLVVGRHELDDKTNISQAEVQLSELRDVPVRDGRTREKAREWRRKAAFSGKASSTIEVQNERIDTSDRANPSSGEAGQYALRKRRGADKDDKAHLSLKSIRSRIGTSNKIETGFHALGRTSPVASDDRTMGTSVCEYCSSAVRIRLGLEVGICRAKDERLLYRKCYDDADRMTNAPNRIERTLQGMMLLASRSAPQFVTQAPPSPCGNESMKRGMYTPSQTIVHEGGTGSEWKAVVTCGSLGSHIQSVGTGDGDERANKREERLWCCYSPRKEESEGAHNVRSIERKGARGLAPTNLTLPYDTQSKREQDIVTIGGSRPGVGVKLQNTVGSVHEFDLGEISIGRRLRSKHSEAEQQSMRWSEADGELLLWGATPNRVGAEWSRADLWRVSFGDSDHIFSGQARVTTGAASSVRDTFAFDLVQERFSTLGKTRASGVPWVACEASAHERGRSLVGPRNCHALGTAVSYRPNGHLQGTSNEQGQQWSTASVCERCTRQIDQFECKRSTSIEPLLYVADPRSIREGGSPVLKREDDGALPAVAIDSFELGTRGHVHSTRPVPATSSVFENEHSADVNEIRGVRDCTVKPGLRLACFGRIPSPAAVDSIAIAWFSRATSLTLDGNSAPHPESLRNMRLLTIRGRSFSQALRTSIAVERPIRDGLSSGTNNYRVIHAHSVVVDPLSPVWATSFPSSVVAIPLGLPPLSSLFSTPTTLLRRSTHPDQSAPTFVRTDNDGRASLARAASLTTDEDPFACFVSPRRLFFRGICEQRQQHQAPSAIARVDETRHDLARRKRLPEERTLIVTPKRCVQTVDPMSSAIATSRGRGARGTDFSRQVACQISRPACGHQRMVEQTAHTKPHASEARAPDGDRSPGGNAVNRRVSGCRRRKYVPPPGPPPSPSFPLELKLMDVDPLHCEAGRDATIVKCLDKLSIESASTLQSPLPPKEGSPLEGRRTGTRASSVISAKISPPSTPPPAEARRRRKRVNPSSGLPRTARSCSMDPRRHTPSIQGDDSKLLRGTPPQRKTLACSPLNRRCAVDRDSPSTGAGAYASRRPGGLQTQQVHNGTEEGTCRPHGWRRMPSPSSPNSPDEEGLLEVIATTETSAPPLLPTLMVAKTTTSGTWDSSYEGITAKRQADDVLARIAALEASFGKIEDRWSRTPRKGTTTGGHGTSVDEELERRILGDSRGRVDATSSAVAVREDMGVENGDTAGHISVEFSPPASAKKHGNCRGVAATDVIQTTFHEVSVQGAVPLPARPLFLPDEKVQRRIKGHEERSTLEESRAFQSSGSAHEAHQLRATIVPTVDVSGNSAPEARTAGGMVSSGRVASIARGKERSGAQFEESTADTSYYNLGRSMVEDVFRPVAGLL